MIKKDYKIFFAVPFDKITKEEYTKIAEEIKNMQFPDGQSFSVIIGKELISISQEYSDIQSFKNQNVELHRQIFTKINEADIILCDITSNNPNVCFEYGMALAKNKNILRVTGTDVSNLAFDIRNYETSLYKDIKELKEKIKQYLNKFLEIKNLDFNEKYPDLYRKINNVELQEITEIPYFSARTIDKYIFKDGAIRLKFKFKSIHKDNESWIGVSLRAMVYNNPFSGYLLHVRSSGKIVLAKYGNVEIEETLKFKVEENKDYDLKIEIDNDEILVFINNEEYRFKNLDHQLAGYVVIASWRCAAIIQNIELINRDSIAPYTIV